MLTDQDDEHFSHHSRRHVRPPLFRRPSLTWILCMKSLSSIAFAITLGPRVEIYTELVCREYTPSLVGAPTLSLPGTFTTLTGILDNAASLLQAHITTHEEGYPAVDSSGTHSTTAGSFASPGGCLIDPHTQASVAELAAVIAIIGGVLSCLTTGWWGGFLDRHGRTRTMGIIILGPLFSCFLTFIVFFFSDVLPGKHWFLVSAAVVEGIMGVPSSIMAAESSYMRDVSEPSNLARNFSLLMGTFYATNAVGPVLGGFINRQTGSAVGAFYAAAVFNLSYALLAWFAVPESIPKVALVHARSRYANELASAVDADVGPFRRLGVVLVRSFWDSFPLNVLAPKSISASQRKDWNLTWLAVSAGLINVVMGSASSVYQYALYVFAWSSLELGSFISASGLSTVVFLMVVLPAIIGSWKCARAGAQPEATGSAILDLHLVRASCVIFAVGYALMGVAPTGLFFTLCFVVATFGQGFLPALQSVATTLNSRVSGENDTGRLFGALGVVYVFGARIIGPALYGIVYASTVSFMSSTILWLSVGCSVLAFVVLVFVRLPGRGVLDLDETEQQSSDPAHDGDTERDPLLGPGSGSTGRRPSVL